MGCKSTRRDSFCSFAASTTIDIRRATALNADLKRRLEIEQSGYPHVDGCVLRELEKPMDYELETAEKFQEKMAHVRQLMADLLVRTNLNEWAAIEEMAEQENEVTAKIRDACNARDMLRDALLESKKRAEDAMAERKERYEAISACFLLIHTSVCNEEITLEEGTTA
ncbi:unnamed protein product [Haemonchus placei]|uniref:Uncharacterized protein n=1 Tax=Haemonchus placei TaxID=6290 RepID=A0A0N4WMQ0_HAEPC|nr:unnamed protein product [Haemonchus placei]